MSPPRDKDDKTVDLAAARKARPRLRTVVIPSKSDAPPHVYTLTLAPGERLADSDASMIIPRLLAAGLALNGEPMERAFLEAMRFQSVATIVRLLDREIAKQDEQPPPDIATLVQLERGYVHVDLFADGQWWTYVLREWGTALAEVANDPVALRALLSALELSLDGKPVSLEKLCELDDEEVIALAAAIEQAKAEAINQGDGNGHGN